MSKTSLNPPSSNFPMHSFRMWIWWKYFLVDTHTGLVKFLTDPSYPADSRTTEYGSAVVKWFPAGRTTHTQWPFQEHCRNHGCSAGGPLPDPARYVWWWWEGRTGSGEDGTGNRGGEGADLSQEGANMGSNGTADVLSHFPAQSAFLDSFRLELSK